MTKSVMMPLYTLAIGGAGAALASVAGLPAAALLGSSIAVSLAAWSGLRVKMPTLLRDAAFAGIGVSLGSAVKPTIVKDVFAWAPSLGLLCLSLIVTIVIAVAILKKFGHDRQTSVLASSPGTMSYAVAVAQEGMGDVVVVLVLQSLRLLIPASVLPLTVFFAITPPAAAEGPPAAMGLLASLVAISPFIAAQLAV